MNRTEWKNKIKESCETAGTYRPFFDDVIDTLSAIMENRDSAEEQYEKNGSTPVIGYTNQAGHKNVVKNPILVVVDQLNTTALAYWRDLGLTPAGLKIINENAMKKKKESGIAAALRELGG